MISALPSVTHAFSEVQRYCELRIPLDIRDQIQLECTVRGKAITIFERRPPWREDFGPEWSKRKIAQFRFDPYFKTWALYAADRNGRWMPYPGHDHFPKIGGLIAEVDRDPTAIFWG